MPVTLTDEEASAVGKIGWVLMTLIGKDAWTKMVVDKLGLKSPHLTSALKKINAGHDRLSTPGPQPPATATDIDEPT